MRIVVVGGSGLIGSKVVETLREWDHEVVSAARSSELNTTTSVGLPDIFQNASVVVDTTESPMFDAGSALEFFWTSTRNILLSEALMGVQHHVALSVVGVDRLSDGGYFQAKVAQERLLQEAEIPHTIIRTTQFFEFLDEIADDATDGNDVRLAPVQIQPLAAADAAMAVCQFAVDAPLNGTTEIAGPDRFELDALVGEWLSAKGDTRRVLADLEARFFGARLDNTALLPGVGALRTDTKLESWLAAKSPASTLGEADRI